MSILPLTRELGTILDCKPVEKPQPAAIPRRPNPGAWPAHVRAEIAAINAEYDAIEAGQRWLDEGRG